MVSEAELLDWLTLLAAPGIGPATSRKLLTRFGSPGEILAASAPALADVAGIQQSTAANLLQTAPRQAAARELQRCQTAGIDLVPLADQRYPEQLRHCPDPPLLLFCRGDVKLLQTPILAIVGARAATAYGIEMAERFAGQCSAAGLTIISGLALGIDAAAHAGCLRADGNTIAVLGCGLDITYPAANRKLFEAIENRGLLVSEYPLGTRPEAFRFPARNRIISGLAAGVLVVEAATKSGSLITARLALEQGKEIFAIPGRIDSMKSAGAHKMVQQGAKLVHSLTDILEELPAWITDGLPAAGEKTAPPPAELSAADRQILALLDAYPREIDTIIRAAGQSAQAVNAALLRLELVGCVTALPGGQFKRNFN